MSAPPPAETAVVIIGLGPGDVDSVPMSALDAVRARTRVFAVEVAADVVAMLGVPCEPLPGAVHDVGGCVAIVAPDGAAHRLARSRPDATTIPGRARLRERAIGSEVARLAGVGAHLRLECPWDREQTLSSIVPHTVDEAFEFVEAVASGDVDHQADELGDLLFQCVFLAQILEEATEIDLAVVARRQAEKLISRHPHVYADAVAHDAARVVDLWERRKREERTGEGIFHELPVGLPGLAYATKVHKRSAAVGFVFRDAAGARRKVTEEFGEFTENATEAELGDVLFALVALARTLDLDSEIAIRAAAGRFRARVERAAELAGESGARFESLPLDRQSEWYAAAKAELDRR